MDVLKIVGRSAPLLSEDMESQKYELKNTIEGSRVLVVGAAGSIGQAVASELALNNPRALHLVDISENNLVELVRTIRSTIGYTSGEFKTYALDSASYEFEALTKSVNPYDYIFNLSAMKHVRSESDPFTLMRLLNTNIFNSVNLAGLAKTHNAKNIFAFRQTKLQTRLI